MKFKAKNLLLIVALVLVMITLAGFLRVFINQNRQLSQLKKEITGCSEAISTAKATIITQSKYVDYLEKENTELYSRVKNLEEQITAKEEETEPPSENVYYTGVEFTTYSEDSGFRSWMPFTAVTDTTSPQYSIVNSAVPDEHGILKIDGRAVVAIGTGWGISVGSYATVTTDQGTYDIVVGDIKADCHTDSSNKFTVFNGCAVEFIVDPETLEEDLLLTGNIATLQEYAGKIIDIK